MDAKEFIHQTVTEHPVVLFMKGTAQFPQCGFSGKAIQVLQNAGIKQLTFVIGGPYGFSKEVYDRANGKLSLSKLTFSHQMIRLFFVEQLYRAFTILRNEPYHHQ